MTEKKVLSIQLFGGFRIVSEQGILRLDQPRLQRLLAYLLLHRRHPRARQQTAFALWPDTNDEQSLKNLRTLLTRLRQTWPDADQFLETGFYALRWREDAPYSLDVADFEVASVAGVDAAQRGQPAEAIAAFERATRLYTGDLMPGWYDEWLVPERERLRQTYLDVLERLAALLAESGCYRESLGYALQLLRADPTHEVSYRQVMQLHLTLGDRASALRVYHTCATTLRDELGVDPSPATQALYLRVLTIDDEPAVDTPPATARPASESAPAAAALVGRQADWETLRRTWQAAAAGRAQLVLITGEAGIGKTRLAEELVAWVERRGAATATARCYASGSSLAYTPVAEWLRNADLQGNISALDGIWRSETARLLPELLTNRPDLSAPGSMTEAWQRQRFFQALSRAVLGEAVADAGKPEAADVVNSARPLLLFLDDVQWCDRDTLDWLHFLIQANAKAPLLVLGTVRVEEAGENHPLTALRLSLERHDLLHELPLAPLNVAQTATLAADLFGHSLAPAQAARLFQDTEGNPLFVVETVRAGMGEAETTRGGDRETGRQGSRDVEAGESGDHKPTSTATLPPKVLAVIHRRLLLLSPVAQALAQTAAVIGREFTFAVLTRASGQDEVAVVQGLDELWRRQIVREQGADAYDFSHDKIRAVAYAELSALRRRALHRSVAEALVAVYTADSELVNSQIAWHYETAGSADRAIVYYRKAAETAHRLYANAEAIGYFQHLLDSDLARRLTAEDRCQILLGLGQVWRLTGSWLQAIAINREALALAKQLHDVALQAQAQQAVADILRLQGFYAEALDWLTQALKLLELSSNWQGVVRVLWSIGETCWYQGDHPAAISALSRQLELASANDDRRAVCDGLGSMAMVYWSQGDLEQSQHYSERSIAVAETIGHRQAIGRAMNMLGNIGLARHDYVFALKWFRSFYAVAREIDDRQGVAWALHAVALVFNGQGDFHRGLAYNRQAMVVLLPLGDKWSLCIALQDFGRMLKNLGFIQYAEELYQQAIAIGQKIGMPGYLAGMTYDLAELLLEQRRFEEATIAFHNGKDLAVKVEGGWLAGWDTRQDLVMFGIELRYAQCQLSTQQAVAELIELLDDCHTPEQQANLYYAAWRINPSQEEHRSLAVEQYRLLGMKTSTHRFRHRYTELTGEYLPEPVPLPDLPEVDVHVPVDVEALMTQLRSVAASLMDSLR